MSQISEFTHLAILGTGILALPVKLEKSGFMPFLTTFTVGLVAQALTLIFMIELLQKTQAIQVGYALINT